MIYILSSMLKAQAHYVSEILCDTRYGEIPACHVNAMQLTIWNDDGGFDDRLLNFFHSAS